MRFEAVNQLKGPCYPLPIDNIDTDQIIPARFLHRSRKEGFKGLLFHDFLQQQAQNAAPDFQWVHAESDVPKMLLAGENFGCGSSREHAVWALLDNGFKVVVAKSFGDIFYGNATNNGLLLIRLTDPWPVVLQSLAQNLSVQVKLDEQTLTTADDHVYDFAMDEFFKNMLLNGAQEIDMTLRLGEKIAAFEQTQAQRFPWLQQPKART
jgi:3-isopropylmalate/(R)-2-methylmalate dehydratase small subunit